MAPVYCPNCERARERLVAHKAIPLSQHLPQGSKAYFPRSRVVKVLEEYPVDDIFTCSCDKCLHHAALGDKVDARHKSIDKKELLGDYATIYGLLIFLRYPYLISLFLQHCTNLENGYLSKGNLGFLNQSKTLDAEQVEIIIGEILEDQYRFRVRRFLSRKTVTIIDEAEILPIKEDSTRVGRGDFGEVYAFDCPLEYMDDTLQAKKINRFARKIFDKRWCRTDTVNEWVAHLHANDLDHPNLMEAFSASHHGNYFFIVSELAQCTLWDFLNGGGQVAYSSQELWTQVHGLASGLAYLHGHEVKGGKQKNERLYHQDLKPSNILIINNVMKIADFGLSDYKPDPRMTDSILVGDSKHEGAKVYAPPSRSGPLSDKYDIYSLGTILSEIASYDVGKETQVDRYRKNRQQDGQESEGSIQFYYPKTFKLKRSVFDEHSDVLEAAEKKRDAPIEATVDRWQENFYQKGLFDLIEQMLHFAESIRPSATEVVEKLESRIHGASSALRGSQPYNIDIWDSTMKGSVPVNARPPDIALNCRLRAFINKEQCGLWLYPDDHDQSVKIRQFVFDRGIEQTVEHVYRKRRQPFKSVIPCYMDSVGDYQLRLIHAKDDDSHVRYVFPTIHEALRFQGLMTGEHAYKSMSIGLRQFTFLKKKKDISLVRRKTTYKFIERSNVEAPTQLQIWTNGKIDPSMRENDPALAAPEVKIAILTTSHLYLINMTNQQSISEQPESDTNIIRLTNVEVADLGISRGIPLNLFLKTTHRYKNNDDTRFDETRHDEVRLYAKESSDVKLFWDTLAALRKQLPASGPLGHSQPILIS